MGVQDLSFAKYFFYEKIAKLYSLFDLLRREYKWLKRNTIVNVTQQAIDFLCAAMARQRGIFYYKQINIAVVGYFAFHGGTKENDFLWPIKRCDSLCNAGNFPPKKSLLCHTYASGVKFITAPQKRQGKHIYA